MLWRRWGNFSEGRDLSDEATKDTFQKLVYFENTFGKLKGGFGGATEATKRPKILFNSQKGISIRMIKNRNTKTKH